MIYALLASQFLWMVVVIGLIQACRQQAVDALTERRELLNRIQRPDLLPTPPPQEQEFLLEEDAEFARVGTIEFGDNHQ